MASKTFAVRLSPEGDSGKRSGRPDPAKPYLDALNWHFFQLTCWGLPVFSDPLARAPTRPRPHLITGLETANKLARAKVWSDQQQLQEKVQSKAMGRPRAVSDNGQAPGYSSAVRPGIYAHIDRMSASSGRRKSAIIRELVDEAIAGRITDGLKQQRQK
jgi:hypothetical protein